MFRFAIARLTFSDASSVDLPTSGVTVLVGPNNAGKSVALRDIDQRVRGHIEPRSKVVVDVAVEQEGDVDDLRNWLSAHAFEAFSVEGEGFRRAGANGSWRVLSAEWERRTVFSSLGRFFVFLGAAHERLGLIGETALINPITDVPTHPLQVLYARPDLEARLSALSFEAFGDELTLARIPGAPLQLHVGSTELKPEIPPSPDYIAAIESLPRVKEQGDGVRSFVGLMLAVTAAQFQVTLVDEPEAFLHPPQARLLGRKLVTEAPPGRQVIVATHDRDVLQGVLSAPDADVAVVRLVRDGDVNRASVLQPSDLRAMWRDPLLRYSNVLDGLFHLGVVVSESDSDSRFYSAVVDFVRERSAPHDLLFTQSGGKQRLPTVMRALVGLAIPVAVIADFDVLRDKALLAELVGLLGGDWDAIETDWNAVTSGIGTLGSAPTITTVREELSDVLDQAEGPRLSKADAGRVRDITRVDDAWDHAKRAGVSSLPQGDATRHAASLLATLKAVGLFVVPVGELERWDPEIPGHGPAWVAHVLERRRHENRDSEAATFVGEVTRFLGVSEPVSPSEVTSG